MQEKTIVTDDQGVDWGKELAPDRGVVEIDSIEVDAERDATDAESWLRLRWPDGSELFVRTDAGREQEEAGAAGLFDEIMLRAMADPVVMHVDTVCGMKTSRWPSGATREGAWRKTRLGQMIEGHMRAAGIETLQALGEMLGGSRAYDLDLGEEVWRDFDAEFIERTCWDHWHGVPSLFWRRLQEALGLDEQQGHELCWAWANTENDEEGYAGRGALRRPCPPVRPGESSGS